MNSKHCFITKYYTDYKIELTGVGSTSQITNWRDTRWTTLLEVVSIKRARAYRPRETVCFREKGRTCMVSALLNLFFTFSAPK